MLRCGLIGCGVIAKTHLDAIDHHPDLECVAMCDVREDRLSALAEGRSGVYLTQDYQDLLYPERLDFLFVLTDHASHAQIVADVIKSGVNVICEKPLTAHADELNLMLSAHRLAPKVYAGGIFQNRFKSQFIQVKEWIDKGELGTLLSLQMSHRCFRGKDYYDTDAWRGTLEHEGGSALINQSIHFLDYLLQLGGEVSDVQAFMNNSIHQEYTETEDNMVGVLRFKSGALGGFSLTNASSEGWAWQVICVGTKGTLELNPSGISFHGLEHLKEAMESCPVEKKAGLEGKTYYGDWHYDNIADHIHCFKTGETPVVSLESAAATTALVHRLYASARES